MAVVKQPDELLYEYGIDSVWSGVVFLYLNMETRRLPYQ